MFFKVKGNSFIRIITKSNLAILYSVIEIKVAIAAPLIPYIGMKILFSVMAKKVKNNPKNKTAL